MKATIIAMLVLLLGLIGAAALKGDGALQTGLKGSALQFARFVPILALAFVLMGMVEALLPGHVVERWLSDASGWRGLGIAWLAGVLTPGGSIIGMPLVAGLYKAGVGPGVLVTYLVSLATLSVMRLPLEVGFYGWRLALLRMAACAVLPFVAGGLARVVAPLLLQRAG